MTVTTATVRPHGGRHYQPKKDKSNKYAYSHLKAQQALSLQEKEDIAHSWIEKALAQTQKQSVAFSGGKDSLVLTHLILQHKDVGEYLNRFPCVFDRI